MTRILICARNFLFDSCPSSVANMNSTQSIEYLFETYQPQSISEIDSAPAYPYNQKKIIVIGQYRGGSTLASSAFNNNPNTVEEGIRIC